ncbi:CC171 protein, partial [Chaetorhynchus papuensis]|nr:CC171 protein [Chaetorhynchus papuensis]
NPSEMDTVEDLARKLRQAEKQNVELINQRNREMSRYEREIMKLRLELEREEVFRQGLQSEISFARKVADIQMYSAEDELCEVK